MVCNSAGSECTAEVVDATLKQALEELLKCMLRVWCREGQALARFGATTTGNRPIASDASVAARFMEIR